MKLSPSMNKLLQMVVVALGGFALLNVAFLLAAAVINGLQMLMGVSPEQSSNFPGFLVFLGLLAVLSWFVLRSKLNDLVKATYLVMPLMSLIMVESVLFIEISIWIPVAIGAVEIGLLLFLLFKWRAPWIYYFAVTYVLTLCLIIIVFQVEI